MPALGVKNELDISINANDFNMLLAVNNSIMQSLKMLETINQYELRRV